MDASTRRVDPDHSWSASFRRTLAEDRPRGVSGSTKAVAANSGASTSGSMAAEREATFERASRSRDRGCEEEGWRPRSGCCSSRSSGHSRWSRSQTAAQERPINALLSQTEAFVERARKRLQAHDAAGRLSRLQEAARTQEATVQPTPEARSDTATQVQLSQQMVNKLQGMLWPKNCMARGAVRQRVSPSHIPEVVSSMLMLIPHDLSKFWIATR